MRRRLIWMLLLIAPLIIVMSCGDDDDPPSGISFELVSEDVNESDGTLASFNSDETSVTGGVGVDKKVKIVFDRPMAENAVISYTVSGTANKKKVTATNSSGVTYTANYTDFYIEGTNAKDTESIIVNKGDTEAYITITVFEDYEFESDVANTSGNYFESVILTLSSVVSGPAKLGTDNQMYTLNILEDDALFLLGWTTGDSGTADLDMVYKTGNQVANYSFSESNDGDLNSTTGGGEGLYLPAGFPVGTYNMSYPYYSGTSNSVTFTVYMFNTIGTLNGKSYPYSSNKLSSALSFSGTYKTTNIHAYTDLTGAFTDVTYVAQTMVKSGINYTNISSITTTANTSRTFSEDGILSPIKISRTQLKKLLSDKLLTGRK